MSIKNLYPTSDPDFRVDFVNGRRVPSEVRFTRDTIGTYVDRDGLIKTALPNEPRYTHDPITGRELGLLVEEGRTNYIENSSDYSGWTITDLNVNPNAIVSPDGTLTATEFISTRDWGVSNCRFYKTGITGGSTISIYVKPGTCRSISIRCADGSNITQYAIFNLDTKVITYGPTTNTYISAEIEDAKDGWYRCWIASTTTYIIAYYSLVSSSSGENMYVWGAQLEQGSYPTSYIPTSGSTVTRSPDIATLPNSTGAIFDPGAFDIINQPFGVSGGSNELTFTTSAPVKSTLVYSPNLSQKQINTLASKTDEFWRWRVTGSSFGLPQFATDGQVTVDWDDGTIETLTTSNHIFTDGKTYHEIGFRLDSGTYFRPYINDNANHDTKVVAVGPAPESMKLNGSRAFYGCSALKAFDATVDASSGTDFTNAWRNCSSLTSFPLINTSSGTNFNQSWFACSSLTDFPLIDTSSGTNFIRTWQDCTNLTNFPLLNTSSGIDFTAAWYGCSSLTSFPLIDTSSGTDFESTWENCTGLQSFPEINTSQGADFYRTWSGCSGLTSFPSLNTSSVTNFHQSWRYCSGLVDFPLIDVSLSTSFRFAWDNCSSLTDFPANFFDSWTGIPINNCFVGTWDNCSSLTATSVENILNSIDTSGQSAPASGVNITIDYNASSGTPNISAAVTNLKSRGWTITLNGVAQ